MPAWPDNESFYISQCIYQMVFVAVVVLLLSESGFLTNPQALSLIEAVGLVFVTANTMALVFLPKVLMVSGLAPLQGLQLQGSSSVARTREETGAELSPSNNGDAERGSRSHRRGDSRNGSKGQGIGVAAAAPASSPTPLDDDVESARSSAGKQKAKPSSKVAQPKPSSASSVSASAKGSGKHKRGSSGDSEPSPSPPSHSPPSASPPSPTPTDSAASSNISQISLEVRSSRLDSEAAAPENAFSMPVPTTLPPAPPAANSSNSSRDDDEDDEDFARRASSAE